MRAAHGLLRFVSVAALSLAGCAWHGQDRPAWRVGLARAVITPEEPVWLAGYGTKRVPEGKLHDLWLKVLALEDSGGHRAVLITSDNMGMPRGIYESLVRELEARFHLGRSQVMLAFSHNHCGPRLRDDLVDFYPIDARQSALVERYSDTVEAATIEAVGRALGSLAPARLWMGEGETTFAVNRRNNREAEVPRLREAGTPLKGPVDHSVPVLAVRDDVGRLTAVLFGYACHPTTLNFTHWCGDYPGFAQIALEASHPGATAMFFTGCGGDQNPLPRRTVELCERYGHMLSDAVETVLAQPMRPVEPHLRTAFTLVDLPYDKVMTREDLEAGLKNDSPIYARWAARMLKRLEAGEHFPASYPYPVQVWRLGDGPLLIALGGEVVVDYSLRFKKEFGPRTWVCGYANVLVAYIPSRRVWEEGGYEGGTFVYQYGHPAVRWAGDVEDRIARAVAELVRQVTSPQQIAQGSDR